MSRLIMIVDDDEDDLLFFEDALQEIDPAARLICCQNGEQALAALVDQAAAIPDFIFLDMNMPLVNGRECLIKMRQDRRLQQVPIIIYSTSNGRLEREELLRLGASSYLTKPHRYGEMVESIRAILNQKVFC